MLQVPGYRGTWHEKDEADRSGCCLKCGQTGRKAKDCSNEESFTVCKVAGHRADNVRCPAFRQYLEMQKGEGGCEELTEQQGDGGES